MKAIVTGHTKGLGAALARNLLARGVPVLGLARTRSDGLAQSWPDLFEEVELDLADGPALMDWLGGSALSDYLDGTGAVLLLNNAGMVNPVGPLEEQDPRAVLRAVTLNVAAPMALAAAVVRASDGGSTRIMHISSGAGRHAYPGWSVYCATKAALDHHARAVVMDAEQDVQICSLAPGVIDTGMQAEIRASSEENFPMRQRFIDLKETGTLVDPDECAEQLVDYLLGKSFGDEVVADLRTLGA
ncbi:SDR family oxidoreductase [Massilia norwichensis]|jgi:benzil reductase ((S)-benzoin forming)|uniref:SDR family oxidoreductase n=1 Tax=Massilia norwichensis TaxID=1442366 RepID=A0ABT2A884_9BURK|nr:SDR family oxidoreductase [Massilia norwichensis]MCS0590307.1 SDR family oxidoreductase [Massilia norwichensis]